MANSERTAAILVAAGRGLRAGNGGPKQYRSVGGQTVIFRAMEPFCRHPQVFAVQPVLNPDDIAMFNAAVSGLSHEQPTNGGATRQGLGNQFHARSGADRPTGYGGEPDRVGWRRALFVRSRQCLRRSGDVDKLGAVIGQDDDDPVWHFLPDF